MSHWFRFYESVVDDPKVQLMPAETFKVWVNILCIASQHGGILPAVQDLAFRLRMDEGAVGDLLDLFYSKQLLDEVELEGAAVGYTPHNWQGRQYKTDSSDPTAAARMQRYRDKKKAPNASVTLPCRNATVTVTDDQNAILDSKHTKSDQITPAPSAECKPGKKSRKGNATAIPDGYSLPDKIAAYGAELGLYKSEIDREHQRFYNHAKQNDRRCVDWIAAERNWLLGSAEKLGRSPPATSSGGGDGMVEVLGEEELAAWDAYAKAKGAKSFPRNSRGGWRFPSRWPPGYVPSSSDDPMPIPRMRSMQ